MVLLESLFCLEINLINLFNLWSLLEDRLWRKNYFLVRKLIFLKCIILHRRILFRNKGFRMLLNCLFSCKKLLLHEADCIFYVWKCITLAVTLVILCVFKFIWRRFANLFIFRTFIIDKVIDSGLGFIGWHFSSFWVISQDFYSPLYFFLLFCFLKFLNKYLVSISSQCSDKHQWGQYEKKYPDDRW